MSLFSVMNVAGSALAAQTLRLNTTASNLANANSSASSLEKTYRARQPVFEPMLNGFGDDASESAVGVQVSGIVESQAPLQRDYEPGNPMADEQGYVFKPNVNTVEEMANMIAASRSYQTNVEIMEASKQMLTRTLAIGQQ
ncbi:MAG: flagellar basal body rod protein FlgC [Gammaproteobacteria bacterium]|nr:flagellar basal body rod protein FlgC [Gammaproteobacteria bacterium]